MRILLLFPLYLYSNVTTIDWYRIDFPPSLIYTPNDITNNNNGYSDKARTKVISNLPNYNHQYLPISINKVMKLAKTNQTKTVCFAGLNKNKEREKFILYSNPYLLSLPNQIVARKDNLVIHNHLNKKGEVSLAKLLNLNLRASFSKERAYSTKIDAIIKNSDNIEEIVSKDISYSYLKQVIAKRIDFTIDYPVNISYLAYTDKLNNSDTLINYPIEEETNKIKVYFGCSKKSGNAPDIISDINNIIKNNKKEMTSFYTDFLSHEQKLSY